MEKVIRTTDSVAEIRECKYFSRIRFDYLHRSHSTARDTADRRMRTSETDGSGGMPKRALAETDTQQLLLDKSSA